jgi:amidase
MGFELLILANRSVDDVELVCRISFGQQGVNRETPPLPYRDIQLPAKLKFGYYTSGKVEWFRSI